MWARMSLHACPTPNSLPEACGCAGACLTWFMAPHYKVQAVSSSEFPDPLSSCDSWTPSASNASPGTSAVKPDIIVLTDQTTATQRAYHALGFNIALYLAVQSWLVEGWLTRG